MKIIIALLLILIHAPASFAFLGNNLPENESSPHTGRLIVKFSPGTGIKQSTGKTGAAAIGVAAADEINRRYRVNAITPLVRKARLANTPERFKNILIVTVPEAADIEAVMAEYAAVPGVEYVEPEYIAELHDISNDVYLPHQWGLNNEGQGHYFIISNPGYEDDKMVIVNGLAGADINAAGVFADPPGNTVTSVLAIIDTGVDTDHPDLADKIWHNPREIADNGIDDDNNGYVDDVVGWDFSPSDESYTIDDEDNDPTDYFGHGTHCAGIAAAVGDNGIGVIGVSPHTKIMTVKIFPAALTSKMARAIIYAADNGADIISLSWGLPYRSYLVEEACAYAYEKGVILCTSTGNGGGEDYNYPAAFETTISVGATNDSDFVTDFSSYGDHIDVCAPGWSIMSLRADSTDMYSDEEPYVHIVGENYYLSSGTSMSCPTAAAVAAYLRSVSPGLIPEKARETIGLAADDLVDPFGDGLDLPGWDMYSGHGRINLMQTLALAPPIRTVIDSPYIGEIVGGTVEILGIADGSGFESYSVEYGFGANPSEYYPINQSPIPVTGGLLTEWNTSGISGRCTIRLTSGAFNEYKRTLFVANEAAAKIIYPADADTVSNIVDIVADAYAPDFSHLVLDYGYGAVPSTWIEIATVTVPASSDIVSDWLVESLPQGEYSLRLSVYSTSKLESQSEIRVQVRSSFSSENAWKIDLGADPSILANYGDIDADGKNEIIVGTSNGLQIFEPDGEPDNGSPAVTIDNSFLTAPAVGRLDADTTDDFVAVGSDPSVLYGFRSGGNDFMYPVYADIIEEYFSESEFGFTTLFLKDIDGDGRDEIHLTIVDNSSAVTFMYDTELGLVHTFNSVSIFLPVDLDDDGFDEFYAYFEETGMIKKMDQSGEVTGDILIQMNGDRFFCRGMTAYDIDADETPELIVYGYFTNSGYLLYAYDENFSLKSGWPHNMGIDPFLVPTVPIFGDVDGDGDIEYFSANFDVSYSYIHAWNLDGSPIIPGNPDGFFTIIPRPGKLNMPLLTDISGDGIADIIACSNDDLFFTYRVQRLYGWDLSGEMLSEFPIITAPETPLYQRGGFRFIPTAGDIDNNGSVDMVMPTADSSLIFINISDAAYNAESSPVSVWRYNRRLNAVGLPDEMTTGVDDDGRAALPDRYELAQNYPNPFNPITKIEFALPVKGHVTVGIYDILGRKVRTLADKTLPAGNHILQWDGTDDGGNRLSSGVYLYSIKAVEYSRARKMVLLK